MTRPQFVRLLWRAGVQLNATERAVIGRQVERLLVGQQKYGKIDLDTDPRNWLRELSEELLDGLNYIELEQMRRERGGR